MNTSPSPLAPLVRWLSRQNDTLTLTRYTLRRGLDRPLRVIVLADLHGKRFSPQNEPLYHMVAAQRPHLILLTGDTVGSKLHGLESTLRLIERLADLAPVALCAGNHEQRSRHLDTLMQRFAQSGALVLQNELATLTLQGQTVQLLGLCEKQAVSRLDYLAAALGTLRYTDSRPLLAELCRRDGLKILLSHFPENFACIGELSYDRFAFDAMFAGHAHGGQFRLPTLGGFYAPGQGLFPLYDAGLYGNKNGGPALVLSRGLGNDSLLPRLNNPPEVALLTIR